MWTLHTDLCLTVFGNLRSVGSAVKLLELATGYRQSVTEGGQGTNIGEVHIITCAFGFGAPSIWVFNLVCIHNM